MALQLLRRKEKRERSVLKKTKERTVKTNKQNTLVKSMIDFERLLAVIKSVLTPEEYEEYLARLAKSEPIEMNGYYAVIGNGR